MPCEAPAAGATRRRRVAAAFDGLPVMDRVRAVVLAARSADPLRDDRRPVAVAMAGRALVATVVGSLPLVDGAEEAPPGASIARRLWPRLTARPGRPARVRLLEATLVLLADHELAASTLAARVTASTWADPYLVVEAGLATLGGPLHGAASSAARGCSARSTAGCRPSEAIGRRLRDHQLIPGFGHSVYLERRPTGPRCCSSCSTRSDASDEAELELVAHDGGARACRSRTSTSPSRRWPSATG